MNQWFERAVASDPAIVVYTIVGLALIAVAFWVSPVGDWLHKRKSESDAHRQIGLLREFHTEMAPIRKEEMRDVVDKPLKELSDQLDEVAERQRSQIAAVEQRLALGTQRMGDHGERLAEHEKRLDEHDTRIDGVGRKLERVNGALDILKGST